MQTNSSYPLWVILLLTCFIAKTQAQQLSYEKLAIEGGYRFEYQWLNHNKMKQDIAFTLTQAGLFDRFRYFKSYHNDYAKKTIIRRIKQQMQQNPIEGVQIAYGKADKFSVQAYGQDKKKVADAYEQITLIQQKVTQAYLKEIYYQEFTNHQQVTAIKVDHARIANDSVHDLKPLKPIILDVVSIQNPREVTNFVVSFVQSIPYNKLQSRLTSSGAGFNPPLKLLWENQGDCDSKMTLTAALLRALMPRIEMVFIYIEEHAFIGINIPAKLGEMTIRHDNITYLLADPTGPALLPVGAVGPESGLAIVQGQYSIQRFHELLTPKPN